MSFAIGLIIGVLLSAWSLYCMYIGGVLEQKREDWGGKD